MSIYPDEIQNKYATLKFKFFLSKIFIILLLSILNFIINYFPKTESFQKSEFKDAKENDAKENDPKENLDPQSLPLNEHYRLLLPKPKNHKFEEVSPEERFNLFKLENSVDYKKMKEAGNNNYIYFSCVLSKVKHENLYVREFVEYYLKLGVEKFYFGDDDEENVENLSDVLDDYIKKGIVDIDFIFKKNLTHYDFYEYSFRALKSRCKWILNYDIDEYLEFTDKNMNLKSYLEMPEFNKCDVVRIHWVIYTDNDLVYYDNRTLNERFTKGLPNDDQNIFHKSIVRGKDYGGPIFTKKSGHHQPDQLVKAQCDALGNIEPVGNGLMTRPKFKYCYLKHFSLKTAEELALKFVKGSHQNTRIMGYINSLMDRFAKINKLTEEKLNLIENISNITFPKYHKNKI